MAERCHADYCSVVFMMLLVFDPQFAHRVARCIARWFCLVGYCHAAVHHTRLPTILQWWHNIRFWACTAACTNHRLLRHSVDRHGYPRDARTFRPANESGQAGHMDVCRDSTCCTIACVGGHAAHTSRPHTLCCFSGGLACLLLALGAALFAGLLAAACRWANGMNW
jgi:hypothetical protein